MSTKTFFATIIFVAILLAWADKVSSEETYHDQFKMCLTAPLKDGSGLGCWNGKSKDGIPFKQWLKTVDRHAVFVRALVPEGGGVVKIYFIK